MKNQTPCHVDIVEKSVDPRALTEAQGIYLGVWGMGCQRCATRVRNSLLRLDGVLAVEISLDHGFAAVAYDERITPTDLLHAVAGAGNDGMHHYQAQVLEPFLVAEVFPC